MYYTVVPFEVLYDGIEKMSNKDLLECRVGNRILTLRKSSDSEMEIVSVFSTNPWDYMDPHFAPGHKIKIKWFIP
ncbi:YlzJ-like family protein [Caldanaerobius polysaccharolyticus]|uniref:YlzJ-like family protein n=1 Tax=Caldanaerobius polysaccharolyticus TaxID=44256 RepID=UPI00047EE488|nr:YlzJ-like family protein [Caldanaerobius polysaccharolyticus]